MSLTTMTFFARFEADILAKRKTITIRDASEKDYTPNSLVEVSTFEHGRHFCQLKILAVEPIDFDNLTTFHAQQENMTLSELKALIRNIYPNTQELFAISYELVD